MKVTSCVTSAWEQWSQVGPWSFLASRSKTLSSRFWWSVQEMAQEVKVLATKFISGTHMMKREPTLKLLWLSHIKQSLG